MIKVRDVKILQEDFEQIYYFQLKQMNADRIQKEAHNSSNEFTKEVSIHLLLVVHF